MGKVFDIQHFSIHDGPGIRTTVFLKGCPLNCLWCHNPESKSGKPELSFNREQCVMCKACEECKCHKFNGVHTIEREACTVCGNCVSACLYDVLSIIGKDMSVDEVICDVLKDKNFYGENGGITISGGEPLFQARFSEELLKEAKKVGLHTAIETSGFADNNDFVSVISCCDLILFDIKETNNELHKKYTGVSNLRILENLRSIKDKEIILRCPIIQGYNDRTEHYIKIAEIANEHKFISQIEIMPYHNLGRSKSDNIGKDYPLGDMNSFDSDKKNEIIKFISGYTDKKVI